MLQTRCSSIHHWLLCFFCCCFCFFYSYSLTGCRAQTTPVTRAWWLKYLSRAKVAGYMYVFNPTVQLSSMTLTVFNFCGFHLRFNVTWFTSCLPQAESMHSVASIQGQLLNYEAEVAAMQLHSVLPRQPVTVAQCPPSIICWPLCFQAQPAHRVLGWKWEWIKCFFQPFSSSNQGNIFLYYMWWCFFFFFFPSSNPSVIVLWFCYRIPHHNII